MCTSRKLSVGKIETLSSVIESTLWFPEPAHFGEEVINIDTVSRQVTKRSRKFIAVFVPPKGHESLFLF